MSMFITFTWPHRAVSSRGLMAARAGAEGQGAQGCRVPRKGSAMGRGGQASAVGVSAENSGTWPGNPTKGAGLSAGPREGSRAIPGPRLRWQERPFSRLGSKTWAATEGPEPLGGKRGLEETSAAKRKLRLQEEEKCAAGAATRHRGGPDAAFGLVRSAAARRVA